MLNSAKKLATIFFVVLALLLTNSLVFTTSAATVDSADGDVSMFFYGQTGEKGKDKPDGDSNTEDGPLGDIAGIIEPGEGTVDFLAIEYTPGNLPATGSNNMLVVAILGVSAIFIVAYLKSGKQELG